MGFQGPQAVAQVAFVVLQGAGQVLMATCHAALGALVIGLEPAER